MKKSFLHILLFLLPTLTSAQSAIQIKSKPGLSVFIILQNVDTYFEETGSNISILNLRPGVYNLSITPEDSNTSKERIIDVELRANEKLRIDVNEHFELEKTVLMLENRSNHGDGQNVRSARLRSRLMTDSDFATLTSSMKGKFLDDKAKYNIAVAGAKYRLLKTEQVRKLLLALSFDENRLSLAKALFKNVIDKQNYYSLKTCFYSSFVGDDLIKFINAQ